AGPVSYTSPRSRYIGGRVFSPDPSPPRGCPMPQAIVDPAELRRFAHNLKQFTNELQNQLLVLHGQLVGLGDTWRDQEHDKFAEEFEDTMRVVRHFMEAS